MNPSTLNAVAMALPTTVKVLKISRWPAIVYFEPSWLLKEQEWS
jgi:hypothetical protein